MRASQLYFPTLREDPVEAEVVSHKFMLRAGFIRKVASGIYNLLPLGNMVVRNIEEIVRDEMTKAGAQEILMPSVIPSELWNRSGRWGVYGKELLRIKDRHDREYCMGPTHEEVVTDLVKDELKSYKNLPLTLFQIQTKFRDEIRPRFGLMRGREFTMKDAYSFHATQEDLDDTYRKMYVAYCNIFERCGLEYKVVDADSGNIGGNQSQEFMVVADTGEDEIFSCSECNYSANGELAKGFNPSLDKPRPTESKIRKTSTPKTSTVNELRFYFMTDVKNIVKSIIYLADSEPVMVLVRGDHEVNEIKLQNHLGVEVLILADEGTIERVTGGPMGFSGPIGMAEKIRVIADDSVMKKNKAIVGANEFESHFRGAVIGIDIIPDETIDIRNAVDGDVCPVCQEGLLKSTRGIEVGHIFKLGTKYSEAMGSTFVDKDGKDKPFIMGCYGIGIGRTAASAVEQNHDENGIKWPIPIAPFVVNIIIANIKDEDQVKYAEKIYEQLKADGVSVILDDRRERIGVKFNDAELVGHPLNVIVGKRIQENEVEVMFRDKGIKEVFPIDDAIAIIKDSI